MKCQACHEEVSTKEPRCPFCKRWGTIQRWQRLEDVSSVSVARVTTGIDALDALIGGGFVPGCVYLLSGPPGCGKSTLALELAARRTSLYAVAEESASAVRLRFDRLACNAPEMLIGEIAAVEDVADLPVGLELLVVDSIHRLRSPTAPGSAGSNGQILHAIEGLVGLARTLNLVVLVIAHVNRDGEASGTMGLEHDVDALLEMTRALPGQGAGCVRVRKNRHGPAPTEVSVELADAGLLFGTKAAPNEGQAQILSPRPAGPGRRPMCVLDAGP